MSGAGRPADSPRLGVGYVLAVTTLTQAGLSWGLFLFPPIAVEVARFYELDPIYIGYQVAIVFVVTVSATLFSGAVIERLGPVVVMYLSIAFTLGGVALCLVPYLPMLALGSVLFGLSHSLVNPSTAMVLREMVPTSRRGLVFSVKQTSVPAGMLASSVVGPTIADSHDWRLAMLPLVAAMLALSLLLLPLLRQAGRPAARERAAVGLLRTPLNSLRAVRGNRVLLTLALAGTAFAMCQGSVVTFTGNMFAHEKGMSLTAAGIVLTFVQLGGICGRLFWGHLADRIANPPLALRWLAATIVVSCLAIPMLPDGTQLQVWYALFFFVGASALGWNGLLISEYSAQSRGKDVEQQMAGAFFLLFSGGALSPLLFPSLHALVDSYAIGMAAFCAFFGTAALLLLKTIPPEPERRNLARPLEPEA